ncbi:hypothetical protein Peur_023819 [Populus x canadensis]
MKGTMDLNKHYKIGGSVYRAKINGRVLAVKKTKDDVTEELKILQKVSHANLVKLMGMSSGFDREGNRFLVYEFAENGSLEKWLHPTSKSSSSSAGFLTLNHSPIAMQSRLPPVSRVGQRISFSNMIERCLKS